MHSTLEEVSIRSLDEGGLYFILALSSFSPPKEAVSMMTEATPTVREIKLAAELELLRKRVSDLEGDLGQVLLDLLHIEEMASKGMVSTRIGKLRMHITARLQDQ